MHFDSNLLRQEMNPPHIDLSRCRIDVLVESVRGSTTAQTRNTALLLLASLAKWVPETVLHSLIPIFTVMSDSTARQNDDFSVFVVDQASRNCLTLRESLHCC